jgi:hypothetical protein
MLIKLLINIKYVNRNNLSLCWFMTNAKILYHSEINHRFKFNFQHLELNECLRHFPNIHVEVYIGRMKSNKRLCHLKALEDIVHMKRKDLVTPKKKVNSFFFTFYIIYQLINLQSIYHLSFLMSLLA